MALGDLIWTLKESVSLLVFLVISLLLMGCEKREALPIETGYEEYFQDAFKADRIKSFEAVSQEFLDCLGGLSQTGMPTVPLPTGW